MTQLETYIRQHAAQFDTREPDADHGERFLARLDAMEATTAAESPDDRSAIPDSPAVIPGTQAVIPGTQVVIPGLTRNLRALFSRRPFRMAVFALAACLALVLVLHPGNGRYFRGVSDDPVEIYLAYMDRMSDLYRQLPWEQDRDWDAALQGMEETGTPLFEQLPDELSARQKGRILKAYYGDLLAGARQLKHKQ